MKILSLQILILLTGFACSNSPLDPIYNVSGSDEIRDNRTATYALPDNNDLLVMDAGNDTSSELDITDQLLKLPNVESVDEVEPSEEYRKFYIEFRQPLDHFAETSPAFIQGAILYFRDFEAPTVLVTTGYGLPGINAFDSLPVGATEILNANQLVLGHRFFPGAIPAPENQQWSFVNIEQSAGDTHEILKSLRSLLTKSWLGTGWSKGGMTILFQEYFHPDDLELAVPMVAPISFGRNDERYSLFLAEIGTKECRDKLDASMLGALNRKLELADVYNPANETERLQNANDIGELIIDFPWSYWQNYGDPYCQFIPPGTASAKDLAGFFVDNILPEVNAPNHKPRPIDRQDDPDVAYDYQAYTQLGFPLSYPAGHLQRMVDLGYLSAYRKNQLEQDSDLFGDYPWVSSPTFDPQPMLEVDAWLRSDAKDIIAVYGKFDPWSAGKITVNTAKNSRVYVANASHSAFLTDLNDADYTAVRNRILSIDTRERALSSTPFAIPKATEAQRETLRKLLRQEL